MRSASQCRTTTGQARRAGRATRLRLQRQDYGRIGRLIRQLLLAGTGTRPGNDIEEDAMDPERARSLLQSERDEVQQLLTEATSAGRQDWVAERETGDSADPAQPLSDEGVNNAVAETLRDRLAAITRAEQRLNEGTFGQSIRSGLPIPDERLEADPAAELTVEEARSQR
jgi:DnaK suppressor protein